VAEADTGSVIRAALTETMKAGLVPTSALANGIMVLRNRRSLAKRARLCIATLATPSTIQYAIRSSIPVPE
jgi:hypothetical protein